MQHTKKQKNIEGQRGFTSIELGVSLFIIIILSTIVIVNHEAFSSKLALQNSAFDLATTIREAQLKGVASVVDEGGEFGSGHGIRFEKGEEEEYYAIRETNSNISVYNTFPISTSSSAIIEVQNVCEIKANASTGKCLGKNGTDELDILFKRPDPDAHIRFDNDSSTLHAVDVTLVDSEGETATVRVTKVGQISVR